MQSFLLSKNSISIPHLIESKEFHALKPRKRNPKSNKIDNIIDSQEIWVRNPKNSHRS